LLVRLGAESETLKRGVLVVALWGVRTVHMRGKFIHTKCEVSLFARHAPFDMCPLLVGGKQFEGSSPCHMKLQLNENGVVIPSLKRSGVGGEYKIRALNSCSAFCLFLYQQSKH
jgi:hypothetical protein